MSLSVFDSPCTFVCGSNTLSKGGICIQHSVDVICKKKKNQVYARNTWRMVKIMVLLEEMTRA
jgi:hypothetical protein